MVSLVIPLYKGGKLAAAVEELVKLAGRISSVLEVVFVVDGSPDRCHAQLEQRLPRLGLNAATAVT